MNGRVVERWSREARMMELPKEATMRRVTNDESLQLIAQQVDQKCQRLGGFMTTFERCFRLPKPACSSMSDVTRVALISLHTRASLAPPGYTRTVCRTFFPLPLTCLYDEDTRIRKLAFEGERPSNRISPKIYLSTLLLPAPGNEPKN